MRLLFVTCSLPDGGAEKHTIALLDALAQRGHECHALCIKPPRAGFENLARSTTPRSLGADGFLDRRAIARFAAALAQIRPEAVIAANAYALMYTMLARRRAGLACRVVVVWHSTELPGLKEALQMVAYRPLFWAADCCVFLCQRQWRYWRLRGLISRRNEVIYNGIDLERYRDRSTVAERRQLRERLGWCATDYVIGITALLRVEKNHLQLLDAIVRLQRMGLPARALIIGDGVMREAIERRVRALRLADAVAIVGLQADVRPWIAACDVMALCSMAEGFSLAALEAMAMGRPMVLSDVGGAAEMVVPGCNGLLFPPRDTPAFVERLAALSDPDAARRMGANARRVLEQRFSETRMVDRYEQLLAQLCRGAAPLAAVAMDR
ncbi:MAG TPA: glycosyltransferase family 4 protein [Steroidobacteraceae bacterium]|nr:glycosyltransferase family 4 protein [Steroidobacteraceae bacterium]